jgi:hypothetical protein
MAAFLAEYQVTEFGCGSDNATSSSLSLALLLVNTEQRTFWCNFMGIIG